MLRAKKEVNFGKMSIQQYVSDVCFWSILKDFLDTNSRGWRDLQELRNAAATFTRRQQVSFLFGCGDIEAELELTDGEYRSKRRREGLRGTSVPTLLVVFRMNWFALQPELSIMANKLNQLMARSNVLKCCEEVEYVLDPYRKHWSFGHCVELEGFVFRFWFCRDAFDMRNVCAD